MTYQCSSHICASEDLLLVHSKNRSCKNKLSVVGCNMKASTEEKRFSVPPQSQINIYNIFIILAVYICIDNIYNIWIYNIIYRYTFQFYCKSWLSENFHQVRLMQMQKSGVSFHFELVSFPTSCFCTCN